MSSHKVADCYYDMIMDMFHHKCVRCGRPAVNIHEIIPRSRLPKEWVLPENRVAVCAECHAWAHSRGAASSADELRELRKKRLLEYV